MECEDESMGPKADSTDSPQLVPGVYRLLVIDTRPQWN